MGAKLAWRIIAPNPGWAQRALWKKYFGGQRMRCLSNPKGRTGTLIHKLCQNSAALIRQHAHWIPGNGQRIFIWDDNIMGSDPLAEDHSLAALREWMNTENIKTLWDLSLWDNDDWWRWKHLEVPANLAQDYVVLLSHLKGKAPLNRRIADSIGWGSIPGNYTVSKGYAQLTRIPSAPPNPRPWQGVWTSATLPKVDTFCWLLCHHRILTEDRLKKIGYSGPSRYSLCENHEENASHMMLTCNFASELWKEALDAWNMKFGPFNHCSNLFSNWKRLYPGGAAQDSQIRDAWLALPKLICWHIWLERNQRIFKSKKRAAKLIWVKIKSHLKECMGDQLSIKDLTEQDIAWGASLDLHFSDIVKNPPPPQSPGKFA